MKENVLKIISHGQMKREHYRKRSTVAASSKLLLDTEDVDLEH